MTNRRHLLSALCRALGLLLPVLLVACGSFEDKRIRELMVEKGFGTRAAGDARHENYVSGRDQIQFLVPPTALTQDGAERLAELTAVQPVGIDGTVFIPYVGPVYVLGKTEAELSTLVSTQLRSVLTFPVDVQARILFNPAAKYFYAVGEVLLRGRIPLETDMTLWDAMFVVNWTALANIGRVYLIRPDAEHPLIMDVNFREMVVSGVTQSNFAIRERDVLYVPPTFLGLIARLLARVLEPVRVAVVTVIGVAQIRTAYEFATGNENNVYFRF
ncbi:MAG: polysaccharide biosynthesis/export family protein [Planctomycetes bacterium]|nr:polysaccharide biosynthesis/export family protein [Planctomycetota bacterium]